MLPSVATGGIAAVLSVTTALVPATTALAPPVEAAGLIPTPDRDPVGGVVNSVVHNVSDAAAGVTDAATDLTGDLADDLADGVAGEITDNVKDLVNDVADDVTGKVKEVVGDVGDVLSALPTGLIADTVTSALGAVTGVATSSAAIPTSSASPSSSSGVCNNSADLCDRQYNQITHMGAHNSAFIRTGDQLNNVAGNQYYGPADALDAGLRLMQIRVNAESSGLRMCHGLCSLYDAGLLETWLAEIKGWMDDNTDEVVTVIIVNSDNADIARFAAAFETAGIDQYSYSPVAPSENSTASADWPTLQEMISANTRLVSFITNIAASETYPYLLPEFDHLFETQFEVTSSSGFNCNLDRPGRFDAASGAIAANYMGLVNHMLGRTITGSIYIPDVDAIDTTNSADTTTVNALGRHVAACAAEWSIRPQFVLVDFWDKGDVMTVADASNGLSSGDVDGRTAPGGDGDDDSAASVLGGSMAAVCAGVAAALFYALF